MSTILPLKLPPIKTSELIIQLKRCAAESWPYAQEVSNLHKPESDNNFGRAATAMLQAALQLEEMSNALLINYEFLTKKNTTEQFVIKKLESMLTIDGVKQT